MSTAAPSIALVFGAVAPPQADVVELLVHLGCSKEVSSYDITLHNHNGKYSPSGAIPITVGMDGSISLGRAPNCPLGVQADYVDYMMGHTVDTYNDIQSIGVEKLRNIYSSAGLTIKPKN